MRARMCDGGGGGKRSSAETRARKVGLDAEKISTFVNNYIIFRQKRDLNFVSDDLNFVSSDLNFRL